jgi:hypothetical protein
MDTTATTATATNERLAIDTRVRFTRACGHAQAGVRATVLWEDHAGVWARVDGRLYGDVFPRDAVVLLNPAHDDPRRASRDMWLQGVRCWWTSFASGRTWTEAVYNAFYWYARGINTIDDVQREVGWFNIDGFRDACWPFIDGGA